MPSWGGGWPTTGSSDAPEANGGHRSTVSFELTPMGETTRLSVAHGDLEPDGQFCRIVTGGWLMILSSLKSLLESGEPLTFPPPS